MYCPTKDQALAALLALLPRGRAWQTNEGGPAPYYTADFDGRDFDSDAFDATDIPGSIIYRFWEAFAYVLTFATERMCALVEEMFCATQRETNDLWLKEYGLPDGCDPFPDLCEKVAGLGSGRCEYFNDRIARMGWTADCAEFDEFCGSQSGCAVAGAPDAFAGDQHLLGLVVTVHLGEIADNPPATSPGSRPPYAGIFYAGWQPSCDTIETPALQPVRCLIERIVPAHVTVQYAI